jgi:hypothetical protein
LRGARRSRGSERTPHSRAPGTRRAPRQPRGDVDNASALPCHHIDRAAVGRMRL